MSEHCSRVLLARAEGRWNDLQTSSKNLSGELCLSSGAPFQRKL